MSPFLLFDATDVDLWVIEPDRFKVFYQAAKSPSGGELSQDQTQGYGPERYQVRQAKKAAHRIIVHYSARTRTCSAARRTSTS